MKNEKEEDLSIEDITKRIEGLQSDNVDLDREWERLDSQGTQVERQRGIGNSIAHNNKEIERLELVLKKLTTPPAKEQAPIPAAE